MAMTVKERYRQVIEWFKTAMPVAETELRYENPFQLLVAVILSAQCTDKRVNMITPPLFDAFPTPEAMAAATQDDIYEYIKSVSYPNNKARNLLGAARMLVEEFGGEVPSDMDDLIKLPGVGRKTANVMLAVVWGKAAMASMVPFTRCLEQSCWERLSMAVATLFTHPTVGRIQISLRTPALPSFLR